MAKMERISQDMQEKFGVKIKCIEVDFSIDDQDTVYNKIEKEIGGLTIGVLVHNVGGYGDSYGKLPVPFDYCYKLPWSYDEYMMRINLFPAIRITKMVLPSMVQRKKGAVLTVSTLASCFGSIYLSPYTYSKAALNMLISNLSEETKGSNITISIAYPAVMSTTGVMESPIKFITEVGACSPDHFAEAAMKYFGRELHYSPSWIHDIQYHFMYMISPTIRNMLLSNWAQKMKDALIKNK